MSDRKDTDRGAFEKLLKVVEDDAIADRAFFEAMADSGFGALIVNMSEDGLLKSVEHFMRGQQNLAIAGQSIRACKTALVCASFQRQLATLKPMEHVPTLATMLVQLGELTESVGWTFAAHVISDEYKTYQPGLSLEKDLRSGKTTLKFDLRTKLQPIGDPARWGKTKSNNHPIPVTSRSRSRFRIW